MVFLSWNEPQFVICLTLISAACLDFCLGDPWHWLHPVQVIGWGIGQSSDRLLKSLKVPIGLRIAGIGLTLLCVGGSGCFAWGLLTLATLLHPGLGWVTATILLASCFAGRSLRDAAESVLQVLVTGDLATARSHLSRYVGRDTTDLQIEDIYRAILETVAENGVDGVMAPLFWAIVGAFFGLAVPFALAFKAASTLDSMVGYREAPYTDLGWCSAKLDDVLVWLPCRLTVLTLAVLSGRPRQIWALCQRDAYQDPSPNSGWSETVYAAVLRVQLGGANRYRGVIKHKPLLGNPDRPITPERVRSALQLNRVCFLLWLTIGVFLLALFKSMGS
ncbi:MAG: adenosylcobinamide-phosphate synthase CbiB [Synechococcales bacterium]|nr:adenosylcobinamide-phosphate synthase CbiB [Synechococcales bacterium]